MDKVYKLLTLIFILTFFHYKVYGLGYNYIYENDKVQYYGDQCQVSLLFTIDALQYPTPSLTNTMPNLVNNFVYPIDTIDNYQYYRLLFTVNSSSTPYTVTGQITSSMGADPFSLPTTFNCTVPPLLVNITDTWFFTDKWSYYSFVYFKTDFDLTNLMPGITSDCIPDNLMYTISPMFFTTTSSYFYVALDPNALVSNSTLVTGPINIICRVKLGVNIGYAFDFLIPPLYINLPVNPLLNVLSVEGHIANSDYNGTVGYARMSTIILETTNYTGEIFSGLGGNTYPVLGDLNKSTFVLQSFTNSISYVASILGLNGLKQFSNYSISYYVLNVPVSSLTIDSKSDSVFQNISSFTLNTTYYNNIRTNNNPLYTTSRYTNNHQYPFGYFRASNNTSFIYSVPILTAPNCSDINANINSFTINSYKLTISPTTKDTQAPIVQWIDVKQIRDMYLLTLSVTDDISGFSTITILQVTYFVSQYLLQGDKMDGVYQLKLGIESSIIGTIDVGDTFGNIRSYDGIIYNPSLQLIRFPNAYDSLEYFTLFQFIPTIVDTSNGPANVTLIFNTTNPDITFTPNIGYSTSGRTGMSEGQWDFTDKVYRIDFQVPSGSFNTTLTYWLSGLDKYNFQTKFGESAELHMWSRFTDSLFPLVTNVSLIGSPVNIIPQGQTVNVGFQMNVTDQGNGLKGGYVEIISLIDPKPYVFNFTSNFRISGDIYDGSYIFIIPINGDTCFNQTFRIQYLYLEDNGGNVGIFSPENNIQLMQSTPILEPFVREFSIICKNTPLVSTPFLYSFNVSTPSINTRSINNRTISVSLQVRDGGSSGLSPRHDPVLYLSSYSYDTLSVNYNTKSVIDDKNTNYTFSITIPYGYFADCPIAFSVYGLVDNHLNLNGYTTQSLKDSGFIYYTLNQIGNPEPFIESTSVLFPNGKDLSIFGYNLALFNDSSTTLLVDKNDGNGFVVYNLKYTQPSVLISDLGQLNQPKIRIQVQVNSKFSNIFTVNVTPFYKSILNPPVAPVSCPSNNTMECSGNGICTSNGCSCVSPFSGPDCSTKNQQIDPPKPDPNQPRVELNNQQTSTNISIIGIVELDINGDPVARHLLPTWFYNNKIDTSLSINYQYTTLFNNNQTNITTTVQWFQESTTINYAYENITIPPFTVKYSITIDQYQFKSKLNTLQLLMKVDLSESTGSKCISQSYGSGRGNMNDIQWMKIRVEGQSLYGQFIRKGIIDGKIITIKNSKLNNNFDGSSIIAINIPNYQQSILVDPYFSYLIENSDKDDSDQCNPSEDKNGLTKQQLIGIIIGSVIAAFIIGLVSIYLVRRKYRIIVSNKSIKLVKI